MAKPIIKDSSACGSAQKSRRAGRKRAEKALFRHETLDSRRLPKEFSTLLNKKEVNIMFKKRRKSVAEAGCFDV